MPTAPRPDQSPEAEEPSNQSGSLQGTFDAASDFSSQVMARLAGRQPTHSRYKLEGEVARGGMGAILRVWDEDLRRHLAMKVVLGKGEPTEKGGTPEVPTGTLARFLEEAQVTGQLDHPGIVPVHELGLDAEGRVYFTMKLVKGKTLKAVFDELAAGKGGWTQTRVLGLILRVCEAMAYAHDKGVIHRDLKPANVMVGKFGEVYVMDWGLAKILGREDDKDLRVREAAPGDTGVLHSDRQDRAGSTPDPDLVTVDGDVLGTPAYMSPEQAKGRISEMGPASDVYAIGAMLYHLVAGHMPYVPQGARLDNYGIWMRVQAGPPTAVHEVARLVPAELVAICEKAMAREAKSRYANTSELANDLSAFIEGRVVHAYETGAWAEARKWVKRNTPLAASLAAAVVLLMVGLVSSLLLKAQSDANAEEARLNEQRADAKTREAEQNLTLAQQSEAEAQAQRDRAEAETAKVLRLSDVKVLAELEAEEADSLWPAYPEKIPALESWVKRARALAANLPGHRSTLAEMRGKAHAWTDEERTKDHASHPRAAELAEKQAELNCLIAQLEQGLTGEAQEKADARVAELEPEVAALAAEIASRRTWQFDTPEEDWQHGVLAELIGNLESLEAGLLAGDATTADHGWSPPKRLAFARGLERGFAEGGEYADAWAQALPAIHAAYPGLDLNPQMGLFPIGPDPDSGLWEFAHLMTGAPAERGADGKLVLTEETGVVLVLLRGGSFWMGAQKGEPNGRNYDPNARLDEIPVHEVALTTHFLSKYELSQSQWVRMTGANPSAYQGGSLAPTLLHPVEQVTWYDCMTWLPRFGLQLPTEAQWEHGARGGTSTVWWTGTSRESLLERGAANLADQSGARQGATWTSIADWPELDDGYPIHAPIGAMAGDGFGLNEVAGNNWEWCMDGYDNFYYREGTRLDPISPWTSASSRVARGGSFSSSAVFARSAFRYDYSPAAADPALGVRPARALME